MPTKSVQVVLATAFLTFFGVVKHCRAVEAEFAPREIKANETIRVKVDVTGQMLIESDFLRASSQQKVQSDNTVAVGTPKASGLFFVRLVAADKSDTVICLVVTDAGNKRFLVESIALGVRKPAANDAIDDALLSKFLAEVEKDRYAIAVVAAQKVAKEWFPKHLVQSSATVTICILPVPGAQTICVARIGDHLVDLGFEFAGALIDECKNLKDAEKRTLRRWLQAGRTLIDLAKIVRSDRTIEKVINAAAAGVSATEFAVKDKGGKEFTVSVIGNNFVGLVDKTAVTIKVMAK